jgi:phosphomannomutase
MKISCFKAYDIRGQIPNELNAEICYRIGNATGEYLQAKTMVVGRDMRLTSLEFADAVISGLIDAGVDVLDIGLCGTEMVYFATSHHSVDGGIMVTASHNPADYNGLKLVREESRPISGDTGLAEIRALAEGDKRKERDDGSRRHVDVLDDYIDHMLSYVDIGALNPLKLVLNPGNGCAGIATDALEPHLPFELVKIHNEPDGTFPNGIPNPLLPENRAATTDAILECGADMGIAWDGDFDRCFLFDEKGTFIEGYYIVGLLAESLRGRGCAVEVRALVHQGEDARGRRCVRRRDERPPLFQGLLLRRQRHDPLVAGGRADFNDGQVAIGTGRRAHGDVPGQRRDQPQGGGCGSCFAEAPRHLCGRRALCGRYRWLQF